MPLLNVKSIWQAGVLRLLTAAPLLLLFFFCSATLLAAAEEDGRKAMTLFGTKEFRSSIKSLPKWTRVVDFEKGQRTFENFKGAKGGEWQRLKGALENKGSLEKLRDVNIFFNRWPYRTDMEAWGKSDYWATPKEFIGKSGDCEDYAITKYYALKDLGVPVSDMRIVALKDSIRNLEHAVLAVDVDGKAYVLDNVSNMLLPDTRLKHYKPHFSVNEFFRWVHLPPDTVNPAKSVIN